MAAIFKRYYVSAMKRDGGETDVHPYFGATVEAVSQLHAIALGATMLFGNLPVLPDVALWSWDWTALERTAD